MMKKAMRPTQANPEGGIATVEAPIHVSNVMLICPSCKEATRVQTSNVKMAKKSAFASTVAQISTKIFSACFYDRPRNAGDAGSEVVTFNSSRKVF